MAKNARQGIEFATKPAQCACLLGGAQSELAALDTFIEKFNPNNISADPCAIVSQLTKSVSIYRCHIPTSILAVFVR